MSTEEEADNQFFEPNHNAMVEIHFNPRSRYMEAKKNGIDCLIWDVSQIFCWATSGRVSNIYVLENIILINIGVRSNILALLETNYEIFMKIVFGRFQWKRYGINRMEVFSPAQKTVQAERQFIQNVWG